jgi:hypothetical protein
VECELVVVSEVSRGVSPVFFLLILGFCERSRAEVPVRFLSRRVKTDLVLGCLQPSAHVTSRIQVHVDANAAVASNDVAAALYNPCNTLFVSWSSPTCACQLDVTFQSRQH